MKFVSPLATKDPLYICVLTIVKVVRLMKMVINEDGCRTK